MPKTSGFSNSGNLSIASLYYSRDFSADKDIYVPDSDKEKSSFITSSVM